MLSQQEINDFKKNGFHIIKNFLRNDEVEMYRLKINKLFELDNTNIDNKILNQKTFAKADAVTMNPDFWPIIFNPKLVGTIKELLEENEIRYAQHSDIHINLGAGRYHRDSACREYQVGEDWNECENKYGVLRVAIYLSDYNKSKSSLVLLPGTHKKESRLTNLEYRFWNKIRTFLRKRNLNHILPHIFITHPYIKHKTQAGDCVVFDQRLLHAGGQLSKKGFPKYSIFLAYGKNNKHTYNHKDFFQSRSTYTANIPETLKEKLTDENLLLN